MCDGSTLALLKMLASSLLFLLFTFSGVLTTWVRTDKVDWGLWRWCYRVDYVDNIERCHQIKPGDSPAYFEAVRSLEVVTGILFFVAGFLTVHFSKVDTPVIFTLKAFFSSLPSLTAALLVMILGLHYKDDERWKDLNPELGYCVWLQVASAVLNVPLSCCLCYLWRSEYRRRGPPSIDTPPPPRRLSTVSSVSITSKKRMTIFRTRASLSEERPSVHTLGHPPGCSDGSRDSVFGEPSASLPVSPPGCPGPSHSNHAVRNSTPDSFGNNAFRNSPDSFRNHAHFHNAAHEDFPKSRGVSPDQRRGFAQTNQLGSAESDGLAQPLELHISTQFVSDPPTERLILYVTRL